MCLCNYNFEDNEDTSWNDFLVDIENNFDFSTIGQEYEIKEVNPSFFYSMSKEYFNSKVINLYKYEPQPGYSPIQENTRRFCSNLYLRTSNPNNYLSYKELQALSNPGSKYGVRDILRFCGNYTKDRAYTSCRHRWIRFKYDTETGFLVRDISQPQYVSSTAAK